MIKRHYTGEQRRALNMIWNAAGRYDFDPPFMAFRSDGKADPYFCMVIGLAVKWFDSGRLDGYFARIDRCTRADEFEDLLWIGIENAVYEKEIGERPVLKKLREERAGEFFRESGGLSRQQMMLQSMLTLTQQEARWAAVLGKTERTLTPRERKMAKELCFSGTLDTEGLIRVCDEFLAHWFRFRTPDRNETSPRQETPVLPGVLRALLRHETREIDSLVTRTGSGAANSGGSLILGQSAGTVHTSGNSEKDLAYIRACCGESILSEHDLGILTKETATEEDAGCSVYVTKGRSRADGTPPDVTGADLRDLGRVRADIKAQQEKNSRYLKEHAREIRSLSERLAASLGVILESYAEPLPEKGKAGKLSAGRAYRLAVLNDPDVFLHPGDEKELDLSVELLLDASASRQKSAEAIAAESIVIAGALEKCHIPVAVTSFSSLRGFTVLTVLKDWGERSCERIADYYTGGWNRDSLAVKADAGLRLSADPHSRKLLLILTDASPNDSAKILPVSGVKGRQLPREYEGEPAVAATAAAVKKARENGIHAAAVFTGSTVHLENLYRIYGKEYVRIGKLSQLADAVTELIRMTLQENENYAF